MLVEADWVLISPRSGSEPDDDWNLRGFGMEEERLGAVAHPTTKVGKDIVRTVCLLPAQVAESKEAVQVVDAGKEEVGSSTKHPVCPALEEKATENAEEAEEEDALAGRYVTSHPMICLCLFPGGGANWSTAQTHAECQDFGVCEVSGSLSAVLGCLRRGRVALQGIRWVLEQPLVPEDGLTTKGPRPGVGAWLAAIEVQEHGETTEEVDPTGRSAADLEQALQISRHCRSPFMASVREFRPKRTHESAGWVCKRCGERKAVEEFSSKQRQQRQGEQTCHSCMKGQPRQAAKARADWSPDAKVCLRFLAACPREGLPGLFVEDPGAWWEVEKGRVQISAVVQQEWGGQGMDRLEAQVIGNEACQDLEICSEGLYKGLRFVRVATLC